MNDSAETAISAILFERWDPIGVNSDSSCRDEYDQYVPRILQLAREGNQNALSEYLDSIVTSEFELTPDAAKSMKIAADILNALNTGAN